MIGLTVVGYGTSAPELAVSLTSALRGENRHRLIGGSNIFNVLFILGISSLIVPLKGEQRLIRLDVPVMSAVACLPIFFTGQLIARWEGALFLAYYVAYTLYLILTLSKHDALSLFSATMLFFVLPLTALTLGYLAILALRSWGGET